MVSAIKKLKLGVKCPNKKEIYSVRMKVQFSPNSHLIDIKNEWV